MKETVLIHVHNTLEALKSFPVCYFLSSGSIAPIPAQPAWKIKGSKGSTIKDQPCYHGEMTGINAEEKLKEQPGSAHLLRYSEIQRKCILSVSKREANAPPIFQHVVIKPQYNRGDQTKYTLEETELFFDNVPELLEHYRKNHPISKDIDSIGEPCFHTPIDCAGKITETDPTLSSLDGAA